MDKSTLTTCLWFNGTAEEAARFYASIFPQSAVGHVTKAPSDYPAGKEGAVLTVDFTLMGKPFVALNAGPEFRFNEAVSFQIPVTSQAESDHYYDTLSAVPEAEVCGWIKDRYGISWQIVPVKMIEYLKDADRGRARRAFEAMMHMRRIDIAAIEQAVRG